jgi:hypothetical protein
MSHGEDYLVSQAKRVTERVESLYKAYKNGLGDGVAREIGELTVEVDMPRPGMLGRSMAVGNPRGKAIMEAIARRVVPKGWNWQVMEMADGNVAFVIGTYEDPFEKSSCCDNEQRTMAGGCRSCGDPCL